MTMTSTIPAQRTMLLQKPPAPILAGIGGDKNGNHASDLGFAPQHTPRAPDINGYRVERHRAVTRRGLYGGASFVLAGLASRLC